MLETKPWYQSTTIRGVIVTLFGIVIQHVLPSVQVNDTDISSVLAPALEGVGAVMAITGRVKANTTITATK